MQPIAKLGKCNKIYEPQQWASKDYNTKTQKHKQKNKNTETQKHKNINTQKHKSTKAQNHKT